MSKEPTSDPWITFVEILAEMPDVIDRLIGQHQSNNLGMCRACTNGGTGQRTTPWPCSMHQLAHRAAAVRRARST